MVDGGWWMVRTVFNDNDGKETSDGIMIDQSHHLRRDGVGAQGKDVRICRTIRMHRLLPYSTLGPGTSVSARQVQVSAEHLRASVIVIKG